MTQSHPIRQTAKGLPVTTVPLILYTDDTSGNRSRKWNKFDNWALLLAGEDVCMHSQCYNNESTTGADASVEVLKLYDMKLLTLAYFNSSARYCTELSISIKFTCAQKVGNDQP